jgi:hypothetical protein
VPSRQEGQPLTSRSTGVRYTERINSAATSVPIRGWNNRAEPESPQQSVKLAAAP